MRGNFTSYFWVGLFLLSGGGAHAQTETPNPGPRSQEEAQTLYREGNEALAHKNAKEAVRDLERLVERYPTFEHIEEAYLSLLDALMIERKESDVLKFGKECLNLKWEDSTKNRVRAYMAEAELKQKNYLNARVMADELLKSDPNSKQKALAYSVRFQSLLEDKQYRDAEVELDLLIDLLKKDPIPSYTRLLPEFKMSFAMRQCTTTHLLKDKPLTDDEVIEYFAGKNLCFKSALPEANLVTNEAVLKEWCESFTVLHHELQKMKIDSFLREKVGKDLKATFDFTKGIHAELSKCYAPLKSKKSHRKRRIRKA